ncbi:Uncharacterised protein [Providencia stuartii]|nr:Uncharacterised protein [Providencia stuartii]
MVIANSAVKEILFAVSFIKVIRLKLGYRHLR